MHPHKKDADAMKSSKMRRMGVGHPTGDGASLAQMAPVYKEGRFGDEEPMNAGAKLGPRPINPRAFKHGGAVHGEDGHHHLGRSARKKHKHEDAAEDRKLIREEIEKHDKSEKGHYADGGRVGKKKGQTTVNVIIAPQGGGQGATPVPVPVPPPGAGAPPPRPPVVPPGGPGLGAAVTPPGGPMGGPMRKKGGRVAWEHGPENGGEMVPMHGGALGGEARLEKTAIAKKGGINSKRINAK